MILSINSLGCAWIHSLWQGGLRAFLSVACLLVLAFGAREALSQEPTQNAAAISAKLDKIHIDHAVFARADITMVIAFLNIKVKDLDPERKGVKFTVELSSDNSVRRQVNVSLDDISVAQFLKILADQTGLKVSIQPDGVVLRYQKTPVGGAVIA